jgi:hypothetical protein
LIAAVPFFSQPSWKRNLQIARFQSDCDPMELAPLDNVAQVAAHECRKVKTKEEKAQIWFYALLYVNPLNAHGSEEIAENIYLSHFQPEVAAVIREIPASEWKRLSKDRQNLLQDIRDNPELSTVPGRRLQR